MKQKQFDVSIGDDDIVYLTLSGDMKDAEMDSLREWIVEVEKTVKDHSKKIGHGVLCLVNLSSMGAYSGDSLSEISIMMKENEPYVRRTATYGGKEALVLAQEAVSALSGRKNFHAFKKEEDAMEWLLETAE